MPRSTRLNRTPVVAPASGNWRSVFLLVSLNVSAMLFVLSVYFVWVYGLRRHYVSLSHGVVYRLGGYHVNRKIGRCNMAGDLAKVVGLDDGQPLLLAVAPKEHRWDLALGRIALGLPHPFLRLNLLASLDFAVKWKVRTDHIARSALRVTGILLCAPCLLPALLAEIGCELPLASRAFSS